MVIKDQLLRAAGAELKTYSAGEIIFNEGGNPLYFYQISMGTVKLCNNTPDGKEFIQNIVGPGQCFGDAFLFSDKQYPMYAVPLETTLIYRLHKDHFFNLLKKNPELHERIQKSLSDQLYYKYIMLEANTTRNPTERILSLLNYLKESSQQETQPFSYKIPLTRQQLANLTGLCVETAIRTIKDMERKKLLRIKERKIFF